MTTETSTEAQNIPFRLDGVRSHKLLILY